MRAGEPEDVELADTATHPRHASEERASSRRIGALQALGPFLRPYRLLMAAALVALMLTAAISLTLPLAVRRVVDNYNTAQVTLLDQYFLAALGIALGDALWRLRSKRG